MRRQFLKTSLALVAATAGSAVLTACGGSDDPQPPAAAQNIVQIAASQPRFSILVEAVTAAGLVSTLSGPGPLTVFAPTNDAFAALLTELGTTKDALLANTSLLTAVLTYHVLAARVLKAQVPTDTLIDTVQGKGFKVSPALVITDGRGRTSAIKETDILASNGVIHVIDKVILPPNQTIVQIAQGNANFSTLVAALGQANLVSALSGNGPFTVFAPTNAAFDALRQELAGAGNPPITPTQLLANPDLATILQYHVVGARVPKRSVTPGSVTPLAGGTWAVNASFVITDGRNRTSNITATDIEGTNGIIHVIDKVILPAP